MIIGKRPARSSVMWGAPFDFDFLERFKIPLKRYAAGDKIFLEEDPGDYLDQFRTCVMRIGRVGPA